MPQGRLTAKAFRMLDAMPRLLGDLGTPRGWRRPDRALRRIDRLARIHRQLSHRRGSADG